MIDAMPKSTPSSTVERTQFAQRLRYCLEKADLGLSPSKLAAAFNLRSPAESVTTHGARKWLIGEAIPTQAKLLILAKWLRVDPSWLRFGGEEWEAGKEAGKADKRTIESDLKLLDDDERELVRALIDIIFKARGPV